MKNPVPNIGTSTTGTHLLQVLSAFSKREQWGVTALADELALSKTVVHRLLKTLADADFVEQPEPRGPYVLGTQLISLARIATARTTIGSVSHKYLVQLAEATHETVSLDILKGHRYVCVDMVDLHQHVSTTVQVGDTIGLHAGAGKAILAFQPNEFIDAVLSAPLPRYTDTTPNNPAHIREILDSIQIERRWVSEGEVTPGTRGLAMPIYGRDGRVDAALTVTSTRSRLPDKRIEQVFGHMKATSRSISWSLGYRPASRESPQVNHSPGAGAN